MPQLQEVIEELSLDAVAESPAEPEHASHGWGKSWFIGFSEGSFVNKIAGCLSKVGSNRVCIVTLSIVPAI